MCWEGNGVRQGFSGGVPGRERHRIFWRIAREQEALGKWREARRGQRGCWGLFWGLGGGGLGHGLGHARQNHHQQTLQL
eukprot:3130767-Rhodomonas_salina.1